MVTLLVVVTLSVATSHTGGCAYSCAIPFDYDVNLMFLYVTTTTVSQNDLYPMLFCLCQIITCSRQLGGELFMVC